MTPDTPALALTGLTRSFGAVQAVDGIDLSIAPGQTVALLGPNGAGKSTTVSMLLGLLAPDAGGVRVFGRSPDAAVREGLVGAMLQDSGFVPGATVRDLVELARALYPRPMGTAEILATAGLTELAGRRLDKLSGGQAQRARFAFALAGNPRLLVLDEPTAALDVAARQAFWETMRRYSAAGHTILFATHYLEEADRYADRVVVVARGRVVADGTGTEIKKLAGGRTVAFDLCGAPLSGLDRLAGVRAVTVRGDRVCLRTEDADRTVADLVRAGRPYRDLEVASAGLQDAFLALTAEDGALTAANGLVGAGDGLVGAGA